MYRLKKTINIVTIGDNRNKKKKKKKKNPKRLKTSDRNKLQPTLILPFCDNEEAILPSTGGSDGYT
nr:unnamed protein product [Callosobruchus chinensis]